MTTSATQPAERAQTLDSFVSEPLRVGEPDVTGPLTVFPIFGPAPRAEYVPFAEARTRGFRIGELDTGASVNDLLVENPTDSNVLLYEGEEVLGAQQNRTFDVSVLVGAGSKLSVPVSCVEAGRWQGGRRHEAFEAAPQAAYPELRRKKAMQARERVAAGLEARADQRAVWDEVSAKSTRMGVHSPTGAMHDIYENRRGHLAEMRDAIKLHDGQLGTLAAIGGEIEVMDWVSRPDTFAVLHGPLVQGYALDALEFAWAEAPAAPEPETARGFALLVTDCEPDQRDRGVGLGEGLSFADHGVCGTALTVENELIQLTAFRQDSARSERERVVRTGRVRRPSRRRPSGG